MRYGYSRRKFFNFFLAGGVMLLLGSGLFQAFEFFRAEAFRQELSARRELHSRLKAQYREAKRLLVGEKYAEALPQLEAYLEHATYLSSLGRGDSVEFARVELALSQYFCGQKEQAVRSLEDIILAPSSSKQVRAMSLIQLGGFLLEDFDVEFLFQTLSPSGEIRRLLVKESPERSVENLYREALRVDRDALRGGYFGVGGVSSFQILARLGYDGYIDFVDGDSSVARGSSRSLAREAPLTDSERAVLEGERTLGKALAFSGGNSPLSQEERAEEERLFEASIRASEELGQSTLRKKYEYLTWIFRTQGHHTVLVERVLHDLTQELSLARPKQESFLRFFGEYREISRA
jgi:hypothetical protein